MPQKQFGLDDDGELTKVSDSDEFTFGKKKKRREKAKRKTNDPIYRLFRALRVIALIGFPVSILTMIVMLQLMGVIHLTLVPPTPDLTLHLDQLSICSASLVANWVMQRDQQVDMNSGQIVSPDGRYGLKVEEVPRHSYNIFLLGLSKESTKLRGEHQLTFFSDPGLEVYLEPPGAPWSPDSKFFFFLTGYTGHPTKLYIFEMASGKEYQIGESQQILGVSWMPDGSSLLVVDDMNDLTGVHTINVDGTTDWEWRDSIKTNNLDAHPTSDGKKILIRQGLLEGTDAAAITIVERNTRQKRSFHLDSYDISYAMWSNDEQYVLFEVNMTSFRLGYPSSGVLAIDANSLSRDSLCLSTNSQLR